VPSGIIVTQSGNLNPSQADITLTNDPKAAGKVLHIPVLDHIIVEVKHIIPSLMKGSCSLFYS
jgi:DNA repair protein RadC